MKCFAAISLLVLCAVATSHGFAIAEKKSLAKDAVDTISSLKESAAHKTEGIIATVKNATKSTLGYLVGIKEAKISAAKNAVVSKYSQLAALKPDKQAFTQNLVALTTAQLSKAYSAISSKAQNLHQYKLHLKDKAVSVVNGAADKVYSVFNKKKEFISSIKKPQTPDQEKQPIPSTEKLVTPDRVLVLKSNVPSEPVSLQTYVSYEPTVVGKVFVPEIPVQIYEEPQVPYGHPPLYGPPANTYGPSIIPL